jgi:hypothetical protein
MTRWISLIVLGGWVCQAAAQTASGTRLEMEIDKRTFDTPAVLNARLGEIAFEETPLDRALDWLGAQVSVDFVVCWPVLEASGIARDVPVTLKIHNVRFSQALWLLLGQAGGTDTRLAYRAEGALVVISTAEDLEREVITKVYDVGDLINRIQRFGDCPQVDLTQVGRPGESMNMKATGSGETGNETRDGGSTDQAVEGLLSLIQNTVEPDSWKIFGGTGTIQAYGNCVIVRNTILVHQVLAGRWLRD